MRQKWHILKNKAIEGNLDLIKARLAKLVREQVESVIRLGCNKGEGFFVIKVVMLE